MRLAAGLLVLVLGVGAVLSLVAAWQLSQWVRSTLTVPAQAWRPEVRVVAADRGSVTLRTVKDGPTWLTAGRVYGLDWGDGWGFVTDVRRDAGEEVTRGLHVVQGSPPAPGTIALFSRDAYPADAERAFPGAEVRQVELPGPTDGLPAWFVPGRARTWAVLVHGRGAQRAEVFRLMTSTRALGMPSLAISYRGDVDNGGGTARLGETEWRDVDTAVAYAQDHGARHVVLVGTSMGASLIATFLERSELASVVNGVVLDSPLLDLEPAVELAAEQGEALHVPVVGDGPVARAAMLLSRARRLVDQDAADHLDDTSWLRVPALVLHGRSDPRVPVQTSEDLAAAEPKRVEAHFVSGAGHVESWNAGPRRYDAWVREFLRPLVP